MSPPPFLQLIDLIQRSQSLTASSSIKSNPPFPPSPSPLLKTLPDPITLIGTLTLPLPLSTCHSLRFSDNSSPPLCCDVLNFYPKILDKKIEITAFNYIPSKCGDSKGFLEIINWSYIEFPLGFDSDVDGLKEKSLCYGALEAVRSRKGDGKSDSKRYIEIPSGLHNVDSFSLSSTAGKHDDNDDSLKAKYFCYGALEAVSPVTVVPCAVRSRRGDGKTDSKSLCGFLVKMLVCDCRYCKCRDLGIALSDLGKGSDSSSSSGRHRFDKEMIVYFCGGASAWHVVITRMIGKVCLVSGLKKKLVYVGKDESELMHVSTEKSSLHLPRAPRRFVGFEKIKARGKGECGCYRGTVTGSYMKGMVIELDGEVMLLLTETQFHIPHSLRVGAIVSIKNVHFVNPRFPWTRVLILGACFRTSITVELFSPLETGCYLISHSQSLIEKFVRSLCFCARLWMLLLITTLRRKFAKMLSEKDILGTRNMEGLAQKFASSHLPMSAFRCQNGVFLDFCKHDSCRCGGNTGCGHLKLVVPISNLCSHCKIMWKQNVSSNETTYEVLDSQKLHNSLSCGGITYSPSAKRIFYAERLGVILLGYLKISSSTGRLQLVDATGKMDVAFSNVPSNWHCNTMTEINDFNITMELPSGNWDENLLRGELFTCQSIFSTFPPSKEMNISFYLTFNYKNQEVIYPGRPSEVNWKGNSQVFDGGTLHMLWLVHKFPILNMFQGEQVDSNKLSVFAEAVVLPWDLLLNEKHSDAHLHAHSCDQLKDTQRNMISADRRTENTEHVILKRCKIDKLMSQHAHANSADPKGGHLYSSSLPTYSYSRGRQNSCESRGPYQIPCNITGKSVTKNYTGLLKFRDFKERTCGSCSMDGKKLLLEFNLESFCEYQALKINDYYLLKHCQQDLLSSKEEIKLLVTPGMQFWSCSISFTEALQESNSVSVLQSYQSNVKKNEELNKFEICTDINISIPSYFKNDVKFGAEVSESFSRQSHLRKGEFETFNCKQERINTSCPSSEMSYHDQVLPEGNLISLPGIVTAVHNGNNGHFSAQAGHFDAHPQPVLLQGKSSICIHVATDNRDVKISGQSYKGAFPAGIRIGVRATFHRILELNGQNDYKLIAASFIEIDSSSPLRKQSGVVNGCATPEDGVPFVPNSGILDTKCQPLQLHCRVLAVYILVLEKTRKSTSCETEPSVDIILAGFVLDSGTSSYCCWANHERAAVLLKLHVEKFQFKSCKTIASNQSGDKEGCGSAIHRIHKMLEKYGRIMVKNEGPVHDSLCHDLTISVSSGKTISFSDENILRRLILNSCVSTIFTVEGNVMDDITMKQLEKYLAECQANIPPLQNIWATRVHQMNPLSEARSIYQRLVSSS